MRSDLLEPLRRASRRGLRRLSVGVACFTFVSASVVSTHAAAAATGTAATCGPSFAVATSPLVNAHVSWLNGVAAVADNNVWAVGAEEPNGQNNQRTLIEHWNGTTWSVQPSGDEGSSTTINELSAIAAISATNIWAVGDHGSAAPETRRPLIEHWTGSAWHIVPNPDLGVGEHFLTGVTAISASDVWAVGYSAIDSGEVDVPIAEHWNGTVWSAVSMPAPGTGQFGSGSTLQAVSGSTGSDVWAAGVESPADSGARPLVEHWNGKAWSIVAIPISVSTWENEYLEGVASKRSNDVWAVGCSDLTAPTGTLVEHWNGTAWTVVPSADPTNSFGDVLTAVSEVSTTDVWAVGYGDLNDAGVLGTLVEHWNGTAWSVISSPSPNGWSQLSSVAALPQNYVWTAGLDIPATWNSLIEQECG
jgi:hypothetical protein